MKAFQLQWKIAEQDEGKFLRDYLKEKQISKRALTAIKFSGGDLFVNNQRVTVRYTLKKDDELTVLFPMEERGRGLTAEEVFFEIAYEDDHCLVINKPAYLPSIPSREHQTGTLSHGLIFHYDKKKIPSTIHIVNRLDKDTSGLMLVAKHRFAHNLFSLQQKEKKIKRVYEAVVHGVLPLEKGEISEPIGRKETSIIEREVRSDGQLAITHYQVLDNFEKKTHVQLTLDTGRTHQIRVHLSHIGHPLCGDTLYGGTKEDISRQALHSKSLSFYHPFLEREMTFSAKLPEDMRALLK
ncbi:RluA family pseudouridine synthase [Metabacillus herbersteinensis]|uniref:Pseudouridine synthase n=1 Tax=Metabacillus herbersteinensis TaxID=283816 RepID=A0ABV6GFJ7_9BACI